MTSVKTEVLSTLHKFPNIESYLQNIDDVNIHDLALVPFNPFPIGAIYISALGTNPADLFGGKWQALDEGRVLIGANSKFAAGSKGGEETHRLTTQELPSHSHSLSYLSSNGSHKHKNRGVDSSAQPLYGKYAQSHSDLPFAYDYDNSEYYTSESSSHSHSVTLYSEGSSTPHNNMQPYLAVYMWTCVSHDGMTRAILSAVGAAPISSPLTALHLFLSMQAIESNKQALTMHDLAFIPAVSFPIGFIYISMANTNPADLFGGKWQALDEGRVLIGANSKYIAGSKGGEEKHTLTSSELASHSHSSSLSTSSAGGHKHLLGDGEHAETMPPPWGYIYKSNGFGVALEYDFDNSYPKTSTEGSHYHDSGTTTSSAGGSSYHNNMQPYLAVYMWQKTV